MNNNKKDQKKEPDQLDEKQERRRRLQNKKKLSRSDEDASDRPGGRYKRRSHDYESYLFEDEDFDEWYEE